MVNKNNLTPKQERFARNLFSGMSQREAWIQAGYSSKYAPAVIDVNACRLATRIKLRLAELNAQVTSKLIANETERQEILSEIARKPNKEPVTAKERVLSIAELNKMDKVYETIPLADNRTVNIIVIDGETKDLLGKVKDRTKKLIGDAVIPKEEA